MGGYKPSKSAIQSADILAAAKLVLLLEVVVEKALVELREDLLPYSYRDSKDEKSKNDRDDTASEFLT